MYHKIILNAAEDSGSGEDLKAINYFFKNTPS